jgi:hypothetical protein
VGRLWFGEHDKAAFAARYWTSIANLYVATAALSGPALRARSEFNVTSAFDWAAAPTVAHDLPRCLGLGRGRLRFSRAEVGARSGPTSAMRGFIRIAASGRRPAAAFHAFIVVIEERAFGADDPAAAFANRLVAVFAGEGADARRLQLNCVKRAECREFGVEFRAGVFVE